MCPLSNDLETNKNGPLSELSVGSKSKQIIDGVRLQNKTQPPPTNQVGLTDFVGKKGWVHLILCNSLFDQKTGDQQF